MFIVAMGGPLVLAQLPVSPALLEQFSLDLSA
jgi:hypothetical protein